ncbi:CE1759 family FMN reductase [Glutamicibacter uratoxydans]|uniref:CE1759 family FMN reductase n=1 Tax=Glutamicibacter uratoxydans TaxID=43667 RepID=UPI003D6F7995
MSKQIVVVSGGLGTPSSSGLLGRQLGQALVRELAAQGVQGDLSVVELRDYAADITNNLLTGFAPPKLQNVFDSVVNADVVIAVSPIFTASVSGLFKSFIDVLDPKSLDDKPVVLAATGGSARHQLAIDYAMRPIFAYLRAQIMPTTVFASSEDWGADQGAGTLSEREQRVAREVIRVWGTGASLSADADLGDTRSIAPKVSDNANARDEMTSLPFEKLLEQVRSGATL